MALSISDVFFVIWVDNKSISNKKQLSLFEIDQKGFYNPSDRPIYLSLISDLLLILLKNLNIALEIPDLCMVSFIIMRMFYVKSRSKY